MIYNLQKYKISSSSVTRNNDSKNWHNHSNYCLCYNVYQFPESHIYWYCSNSMWNRIHATVERLSVCPIDRQQQRRPVGLLLSAGIAAVNQWLQALCCRCQRSGTNAGSVMLTADGGDSAQNCYNWLINISWTDNHSRTLSLPKQMVKVI